MAGDNRSNPEPIRLPIWSPGALERAAELLRRGRVVAFPTDTVYGLGAHAFLPEGVERLYSIKGRPHSLPIPLLLSNAEAMEVVCAEVPPLAWRLSERFWPGGLSLILRRAHTVPDGVTAGGSTVAVRVPDHALVRELCHQTGAPVAATSANRHGQPAPITAEDVLGALGERVPLILDGGACQGGVASTVLDLTRQPPVILRAGPVTAAQLGELTVLEHD